MAFSKTGDSQILKVMSVENGKPVEIKKRACVKCGNTSCTCNNIKHKVAEGQNETKR